MVSGYPNTFTKIALVTDFAFFVINSKKANIYQLSQTFSLQPYLQQQQHFAGQAPQNFNLTVLYCIPPRVCNCTPKQ
jgi:hypothetical protein